MDACSGRVSEKAVPIAQRHLDGRHGDVKLFVRHGGAVGGAVVDGDCVERGAHARLDGADVDADLARLRRAQKLKRVANREAQVVGAELCRRRGVSDDDDARRARAPASRCVCEMPIELAGMSIGPRKYCASVGATSTTSMRFGPLLGVIAAL